MVGESIHAHDVLQTAFGRPGTDVPRAGVRVGAAELLEPRPAGFQRKRVVWAVFMGLS